MRQITPKIGKTELVTNRVRSMAGIVARAGARVRIGNVVGGEELAVFICMQLGKILNLK
ncbi:MAG: hypothetical protein CM15mP14_4720 [Rhodospirillaceae bacterium]|nr:MAG: hypothetical protein CM15mP14_4720 [Rhodospirillaceae bacterium]